MRYWDMGYAAYYNGSIINPFKAYTLEAITFERGWFYAKQENEELVTC